MSGNPPWFQAHCQALTTYGPLPKGINVGGKPSSTKHQYHVTVDNVKKTFANHPLSPHGRKEWGNLLRRAGEEKGKKAAAIGVAHPPILYKPGEWVWEKSDDLHHVLLQAFELSKSKVKLADLDAQGNMDAIQKLVKNTPNVLYHPHDRQLAIFDREHVISCTARHHGRSLIIVGPEINKDRKNYASFIEPGTNQRMAVRARWSTGSQGELPPIVLGCLPRGEKFAKEPSSNTTIWYTLVPTIDHLERYQDRWSGCRWSEEASRFGYAKPEAFIWAVVAIQRSIVMGALQVRDDDLGDHIMQYGRYLVGNKGHGTTSFVFKKSQDTNLPKITFDELTIWILASEDSNAKKYAKAWDSAVLAYLRYRKSLNLPDWELFVQSAAAAQIKK